MTEALLMGWPITKSTNHERDDVSDAAGQLEHDDDERDSHPGDAAEGGGRADHGVEAGRDAGLVLAAFAAEEVRQGVVVREYHLLHADPHQSGREGRTLSSRNHNDSQQSLACDL